MHSAGVNGDINNQLLSLPKKDILIESDLLGTRCWLGAYILLGSQLLLCRIAVARSQIDSNIVPHSDGQGSPPKLKQSIMRRRPILTSCRQDWTAVAGWRCNRWKADLKSTFKARILTLGNLHQAMTAQLTICMMQAPNMQGRSSLAQVQLLTDVPDDHLKLWSWVKRSFSMIHSCSLSVFCFWMFIGASRIPGMFFAFPNGRGGAIAKLNIFCDKFP